MIQFHGLVHGYNIFGRLNNSKLVLKKRQVKC